MRASSTTVIKILIAAISVAFVCLFSTQNSQSKPFAESSVLADGAAIYAERCASCHGADGRAQTPKGKRKGATDFTSSKWKPNDARLMKVIANGKAGMPAFKDKLNEDEIKAVTMYIKTFKK